MFIKKLLSSQLVSSVSAKWSSVKQLLSSKKDTNNGTYHIVWDTDSSKWLVKKDGKNSPVSDHSTKKSAMDAGQKLSARLSNGKIIIYKMDGEVQKSIVVDKKAA